MNVNLLQKQFCVQSITIWPFKQLLIHLNAKYNLGDMSLKPMRTNICTGQKCLWQSTIFFIAGLHEGISGHTQGQPQQEGMPSTWLQEGHRDWEHSLQMHTYATESASYFDLWSLSRMEEKCMECSKNNACSAGRNTATVSNGKDPSTLEWSDTITYPGVNET